jgi:hypothetical protein
MKTTEPTPAGVNAPQCAQPYSYDNSRPFSVFALAVLATLGVLGMTWGAHAALSQAAVEQQIAPPPDLKKVVERLEETADTLIKRGAAA